MLFAFGSGILKQDLLCEEPFFMKTCTIPTAMTTSRTEIARMGQSKFIQGINFLRKHCENKSYCVMPHLYNLYWYKYLIHHHWEETLSRKNYDKIFWIQIHSIHFSQIILLFWVSSQGFFQMFHAHNHFSHLFVYKKGIHILTNIHTNSFCV